MPDATKDQRALDAAASQITFVGDGWNIHQLGTDEGGGIWLRGLATTGNTDGSVTVVVAGSQGNMFSATVAAGSSTVPAFSPVSRTGSLGTIPAFKWFDGVSFGGAQPGTLGFATGYHGLLMETTDGGQTWTDLTDPSSTAALQADVAGVGISPGATVDGDGTTPVLVATSLAPNANFYPPVHYGTIDASGAITWAASALFYDDGTTTVPLDPSYYDRILQSIYLSDTLVLASGNALGTTTQTAIYPLLLSTDGGVNFFTIPNFPQDTGIGQLHEIVADPDSRQNGIVWGAGTKGIVLRIDLSSYFGSASPAATFSESTIPVKEDIYGLAVSPDDSTIVAVTKDGKVYWANIATGTTDPTAFTWKRANDSLAIGEVWSAQFITDSTVVVIGQDDSHLVSSNTIETTGTTQMMLWASTDAGKDWSSIAIDSHWSTQQTALTGVIDAFTSGTIDHLTNAQGEIPTSQDTLLLSGATIDVTSTLAATSPAMIILPPASAPSSAALSVDTEGNDLTLNSVLSGSGELLKTGLGTLLLKPVPLYNPDGTPDFTYQANFQSGGVEIDGGVVSIDLDAELGVANANQPGNDSGEAVYPNTGEYALTLNGGTLQAGQDLVLQTISDAGTLTRPVVLGSSSGAFDPNGFTMTLPGAISGSGGLIEAGSGTLALDAVNSFGGGITVESGRLSLQLSGALPSGTRLTVDATGSVRLDGTAQTASAVAGANGGAVDLDAGMLTIEQTAIGPGIDFGGGSGQLVFASSDPSVLTGGLTSSILGFSRAAAIDLTGVAFDATDTLHYADGTLAINSNGGTIAVLHFDPARNYDFALGPGIGDTLALTDLACFAAGTRIATPNGEVPVERLRVGEPVVTVDGGEQPIVWLGYRRVACCGHPRPERVWPIRVRAHAFGEGRPKRDLLLSAEHAVFVADVLIPIKHLINGTTIAQIVVDEISYHHIELPQHDVLLAEDLPAESYLACGDRSAFGDAATATRRFPARCPRPMDIRSVWDAYGYAPLVVCGPAVHAARRQIEGNALSQAGGKRNGSVIARRSRRRGPACATAC